jgi:hypothetical protein
LFSCMKSLKVCQWVLCDMHVNGVAMKPNMKAMKAMKRAMKAKATAPATAMKAMKK